MHTENLSTSPPRAGEAPAGRESRPDLRITRSDAPSAAPGDMGKKVAVQPPLEVVHAGERGRIAAKPIKSAMMYPWIRHLVLKSLPRHGSRDRSVSPPSMWQRLNLALLPDVNTAHLIATKAVSVASRAEAAPVVGPPLASSLHWVGSGLAALMARPSTPVAPSRYPYDPALLIVDFLSGRDAHALGQVDKLHRELVAGPAAAYLLEQRIQSLLELAVRLMGTYVSHIADLLGSVDRQPDRGGSGILGLPLRLREGSLAGLEKLARRTRLENVATELKVLRESRSSDAQRVLCRLAEHAHDLVSVQSILGRRADEYGWGASGILSLPAEQQGDPLRRLVRRVAAGGTFFQRDWEAAMAMLAQPIVALGEDEPLELLTSMAREPLKDPDVGALRTLWTATCTEARGSKIASLFHLRQALRHFPAEEKAQRFDEYLTACEQLVEQADPRVMQRDEHSALRLDEVLGEMLRRDVPKSFRATGQQRLLALQFSAGLGML